VLGQNPRILKGVSNPPEVYEHLWQTITQGHVWKGTLQNRRKDGTFYMAEQTIAPVFDKAGNIVNYISIHEDVTLRQSAEEALRADAAREARELAEQECHDLREELAIARTVQQRMFPKSAPEIAGFDIAGRAYPAGETGGDYFDFIPLRDGTLGIVIGDVCGHGLGPALLTAELRGFLRAVTLCCTELPRMLEVANTFFGEDTEEGQFATLLFAELDPVRRTLRHAAAGHEGLCLDAQGKLSKLPATGMVLGLMERIGVRALPARPLREGDVFVFVTDGLQETQTTDQELFGVERILDVVRRHQQQPAAGIVEALYAASQQFAAGAPQHDDVTIVIVKVLPEA
jgi:sigma-B regulation protein RsbU (phosphoserine phosphatase)